MWRCYWLQDFWKSEFIPLKGVLIYESIKIDRLNYELIVKVILYSSNKDKD